MDKEMLEQFQLIIQGMADMESRLNQRIKDAEIRINTKIENDVTKRIDSLFDGYMLLHEKQEELERRADALQETDEALQARVSALENRIA